MDYILTFRRLLAPVLIRIIYYIGAAFIIIGGILDIIGVDHLAERAQAQAQGIQQTTYDSFL